MGIAEILRRVWLFYANKIRSPESFRKHPTQLIIVAHDCHISFLMAQLDQRRWKIIHFSVHITYLGYISLFLAWVLFESRSQESIGGELKHLFDRTYSFVTNSIIWTTFKLTLMHFSKLIDLKV